MDLPSLEEPQETEIPNQAVVGAKHFKGNPCAKCGSDIRYRAYRHQCVACVTSAMRAYRNDPIRGEDRRAVARWRIRKRKLDVMKAYGGAICACCGEDLLAFLTLDHINGDGAAHRMVLKKAGIGIGSSFYSWLQRNNYPAGLQVLCLNCNFIKGVKAICPCKVLRQEDAILKKEEAILTKRRNRYHEPILLARSPRHTLPHRHCP